MGKILHPSGNLRELIAVVCTSKEQLKSQLSQNANPRYNVFGDKLKDRDEQVVRLIFTFKYPTLY